MRPPRHPQALTLFLEVLPRMHPLLIEVRKHDRHLADQLKRAATSVALNLGEADGSDPGTRRARLHSALGSLSETRTGLKVALAWHYLEALRVEPIEAALDRVAAMTWRRIHKR